MDQYNILPWCTPGGSTTSLPRHNPLLRSTNSKCDHCVYGQICQRKI